MNEFKLVSGFFADDKHVLLSLVTLVLISKTRVLKTELSLFSVLYCKLGFGPINAPMLQFYNHKHHSTTGGVLLPDTYNKKFVQNLCTDLSMATQKDSI